jgi:hypothetical protein
MQLMPGDTFRGLVNALGSAGASVAGTDKWCLAFHLAAWRENGQVETGRLRCELPVSKPELAEAMKLVRAYSIVEMRVAGLTTTNVVTVSSIETRVEDDVELANIRAGLQIPVYLTTQHFGQLVLDRRFGEYAGEVDWWGSRVSLALNCEGHESTQAVLAAANELFNAKDVWNPKITEFAADRLLQLKNDYWLDEDEGEISRAKFISCMTMTEVSVDEGGYFTFYYDDGDIFLGHGISVSGNLKQGLLEASI